MTTQLVFDKILRANVPIWIISLDLSKAFDRVHWPALWRAVSQQGLSNHMISILEIHRGTKKDKSLQMMFAVDHSRCVMACEKAAF